MGDACHEGTVGCEGGSTHAAAMELSQDQSGTSKHGDRSGNALQGRHSPPGHRGVRGRNRRSNKCELS